jgi:hypothetical protein
MPTIIFLGLGFRPRSLVRTSRGAHDAIGLPKVRADCLRWCFEMADLFKHIDADPRKWRR